jgi:hypothetical protein
LDAAAAAPTDDCSTRSIMIIARKAVPSSLSCLIHKRQIRFMSVAARMAWKNAWQSVVSSGQSVKMIGR